MNDIVDKATRSRMMGSIRGRDTDPERRVRAYLHRCGLRFRVAPAYLPGRPDIVFPAHRVALFVHGCFWHRHPGCRMSTTPATRREFWTDKFRANQARDRRVESELLAMGWHVLVIWECETSDSLALDRLYWLIRAMDSAGR